MCGMAQESSLLGVVRPRLSVSSVARWMERPWYGPDVPSVMTSLRQGVRWIAVDDGLTIFVPAESVFIDLDSAGAELFDRLVEDAWNLERTSRRLAVERHLAVREASRVVETFVGDLRRLGVVDPDG